MSLRSRGKVILLGEHAVVYGYPALAASLSLGVKAHARMSSSNHPSPSRLRVDTWGIDTERDPDDVPARAFQAILAALGLVSSSYDLRAHAMIPARAGLGSSAALAVAVTRALLWVSGRPQDLVLIEQVANEAEKIFHGNPSGIDVAISARGGIGLFTRDHGLESLELPPFRLAVGLSASPRDTAGRVADVARRHAEDRGGTEKLFSQLGALTLAGKTDLQSADFRRLGERFDNAQEILRALGLSSPVLDRLCLLARGAGAFGAKLTGAGGGGAVIAVGNEDTVVNAWRAAGYEAQVVQVGVPG